MNETTENEEFDDYDEDEFDEDELDEDELDEQEPPKYGMNTPEFNEAFRIHNSADALKDMVKILDDINRGFLPVLPETKKAAKSAIKEICAVLCEYEGKV